MSKQIPLTKGKFAIIDDADFESIKMFRWSCTNTGYAARAKRINGKSKYIPMHRVILNAPDGIDIDHINGNRLDNRRCNLRLATRAQNVHNSRMRKDNTSGFKGVYKRYGKFVAKICFNHIWIWLGLFPTAEEASQAYQDTARKLHGNFFNPDGIKKD